MLFQLSFTYFIMYTRIIFACIVLYRYLFIFFSVLIIKANIVEGGTGGT